MTSVLSIETNPPERPSKPRSQRERDERTQALLVQLDECSDPAECERLREAIVLNNLEMARSLAWRYARRGVPVDDLVQVASLALVKAVRAFDPQRSDKF